MFRMLLPLVIFFFYWRPFFIFLISHEKYKHNIRSMTIFLGGKLKCGFPEKLNDDGKRLPLFISKVTIKKSYEASHKLPLTAISARYLKFFVIGPRDWWDAFVCFICLSLFFFFKHPIVIYNQVSSFKKTFFYWLNVLPR